MTWNLRKRDDALTCVIRYIKRLRGGSKDYLIALQESAEAASDILKETGGHATGNGGLVLLSSQSLSVPAGYRPAEHLRFIPGITMIPGRQVTVVNYHGHSQAESLKDAPRGGYASEYRWTFERFATMGELLILGDFNQEPDHDEIAHRACFSLYPRDGTPHYQALRSHARDRLDIRVIAPPATAGATCFYSPNDRPPLPLVYDYFAATPDIAAALGRVETLKELEGFKLGSADGRPILSDHFPVRASWDE